MAERSTLKPVSSSAVPSLVPQGEQAGKPAMPLGRPFTLIGSRNRAHLHLLSSSISRNHAALISTDTGLYIRDLASRTGVSVNGRKVKEADLHDGEIVQIGSFRFRYTDASGTTRLGITPKPTAAMLEVDGTTLTPIDSRTILIGRRPTCDIALPEASVSNTHAMVFEINGQRFIRDLGSRTGTLVNGKPVHHQELEFGDEIRIGETQFRYVSAVAPAEHQPSELEAAELEDEEPIGLAFDDEEPARVSAVDGIPEADLDDLLPGSEPPAEQEADDELIPLEPVASESAEAPPVHSTASDDGPGEEHDIDFEIAGSQLDLQNKLVETSRLAAHPEEPPAHAVTASDEVLRPVEDLGLDFLDESEHPIPEPAAASPEEPIEEMPTPTQPDPVEPTVDQLDMGASNPLALEPDAIELPLMEEAAPQQFTAPADLAPALEEEAVIPDEIAAPLAPAEPQAAWQDEGQILTADALSVSEPEPELSAGPLEGEAPAATGPAAEEIELLADISEAAAPSVESEAAAEAVEPLALEPIDLSVIDLGSEAPPSDQPVPVEAEAPAPAPEEPTPILDQVAEALPEPPVEPEITPAPAPGKRPKKPRGRKKKTEAAAESQVAEPAAANANDANAPVEQVPLVEAAGDWVVESTEPLPPETIATADDQRSQLEPAQVSSTTESAEVITPTDPTPDSAQELGEAIDEIATAAPAPDMPPSDPLTDTAFDRIVEEFAGPESQPLVEQSAPPIAEYPQDARFEERNAPAADAQATVPDEGVAPVESPPLAQHAQPVTPFPDPDEAANFSQESPAEQALTTDVSLDDVIELDSSALLDDSEPEPLSQEPAQPFEFKQDVAAAELAPEPMSGAAHAEEAPSPIDEQPVTPPAEEIAERSSVPAAPVNPFFGMERDLGSFLGGIPLGLPTARAARQEPAEEPPTEPPYPEPVARANVAPPEPPIEELPPLPEDEFAELTEAAGEPSAFLAPEVSEEPVSSHVAPPAPPEVAGLDDVPDLDDFAADEKLNFSQEPDDLPPLDTLLADDSAPLELFDGTAEKLDDLPDTMEAIGDVDGVLAEERVAPPPLPPQARAPVPPAVTPPPVIPANPKPAVSPFAGNVPAAPPVRPRVTPPPPTRTSPLRSFEGNPFQLSPEDVPLSEKSVPPFSGEQPPNRGRVTSFEGLAMPPVREADVFSSSAFAELDEAFFGKPAGQAAEIPESGKRPQGAKTQQGAAPTSPGAAPPDALPGTPGARKPRERKRDAIPPNRQSLPPRGGQPPPARPLAQPSAANPPPPPGTPKRVPWWKKVRTLLPLMILCLLGAWVGIIVGLPPRHRIEGALRFEGLENLDPKLQKQRVDSVRQLIRNPDLRAVAVENAKNSGAPGGFLDDPAVMQDLSGANSKSSDYSEFSGGRQALLLVHSTDHADLDRLRMKAVLTALYSRDGSQRDTASSARRELDNSAAKIKALEAQKEQENSKLVQLEAEIRVAGGTPTPQLLQGPALWVSSLEDRDKQLWDAWQKAFVERAQRQAALDKAQAATPSAAAPADIDNDPEVRRLKASIEALNTRLGAARDSGSGNGQDSAGVLTAALARLDDLLSTIPDSNDPAANAYLANARGTRDEVQQILNRTRAGSRTADQLRQQLSQSSSAGQVTDPALRDLLQERNMNAHRYEAAAGSGLAEDATKIRGVLDDLDRKIEARRKAIGGASAAGPQPERESLAQLEADQKADVQRIHDRLSRLDQAAPRGDAIPAAAREQIAPVVTAVSIAAAAADRFAASGPNAGPAGDASKIEAQLAAATSQLEQKRKELADAASRQLSDQDRQARDTALADDRRALIEAGAAADRAGAAYASNLKLLSLVRELADERGRIAAADQQLQLARQDLEQRQKTANLAAALVAPDDSSVSITYGQDNRLMAIVVASVFLVGLFGILMWKASSQPHTEEVPFASAVAIAHDVPGHRPEDFAASGMFEQDEREPMIA